MKRVFFFNKEFEENLENLRKKGGHASIGQVIKEALIRYEWILTQEQQMANGSIRKTQDRQRPQPKKRRNMDIRLVHSDKDK